MKTVYLAGPINGCSDTECKDWRELVKSSLAGRYVFLDPMSRDYRGVEKQGVDAVVLGDKIDISNSDIVLAYSPRPSYGTAMEIIYAHSNGRRVFTITDAPNPSPWLLFHSHKIFSSIEEAITHLGAAA